MGLTLFDRLLDELLGLEGGYRARKDDSGGPTRYGITESVARAYGYQGRMAELPLEVAKDIYRHRYWLAMKLGEVAAIYPAVAAELFDSGVNCGVAQAGKWLQRALNVLNQQGAWWPDIEVDGGIGRMTLAALGEYAKRRGAEGETVLVRALNGLQAAHYIGLAEDRPKDEAFVYGWLLKRVR